MQIRAIDSNGRYDILPATMFQSRLAEGKISAFFRESEKKWIIPGVDPMRIRSIEGSPRRRYSDVA